MRRPAHTALLCLALLILAPASRAATFTSEQQMQDSLLGMLARFTTYAKSQFQPCREPNSLGEACGCFRSGSTMKSNEDGVRTNADLGMVCAFLCRYGRDRVELPAGVTWAEVDTMARQSLAFACSTHKANRLKPCADGRYWGSTSVADHVWESSLWAMSVAYQALFLWPTLPPARQEQVYRLLRAECDYELERTVPTGYDGDTKAEENGWEADVLAAALALFPTDPLAPRWQERLRLFAVNSYSHPADATSTAIVATSGQDTLRVSDLYRGANLYPDYTLQNHNYFHTSYQNVVIQELGEAALLLALSPQKGLVEPNLRALTHHCREVCDSVLYWLALDDGELAMPNGNDWSLFLYDQMTSYTTMACLLHDADALMLERRAAQMIAHRQRTTPDGSWLLRSDIGPRRMGVEAHRVMMTWLMHHQWPTGALQPTAWDSFRQRHAQARLLPCQQVVRAATPGRFSCFSWSRGLGSYTGYVAPFQQGEFRPEESNLVVPFKAHNTGNLLGWYDVEGRRTNAVPASEPRYQIDGSCWTVGGHLLCNDSALDLRFALHSTACNAVAYIDEVRARDSVTITAEQGGLLAISQDPFTHTDRSLHYWRNTLNIDDQLSLVGTPGKQLCVGRPREVNSVMAATASANHYSVRRTCAPDDVADRRFLVVYTGVSAQHTRQLATAIQQPSVPPGWGALVFPDTDGTTHLLIARFGGTTPQCTTPHGTFTLNPGEVQAVRLQ